MNIVFWSMTSGRSGTSGNMLAVSTMASLVYSVQGILLQLDYCSTSIDDAFEEKRQTNLLMDEFAYYSKKGLDQLMDKCQMGDIGTGDLTDNAVPVKNTCISYIPASKRSKYNVNEKDIIMGAKKILTTLNKLGGVNYVDCTNGDIPVSNAILKRADVVVINLCQGMNVSSIDMSSDILRKAVFLIGKYDDNSSEDVNAIRYKYGIDREEIAVIPYNIKFHDAIQQGKLVPYMVKHITAKRSDDNFQFVNNVFKATNMILRKAGYDEERKAVITS